jgi:hypothetical protein
MTVILRFADLKERGITNSWPQLKRLQTLHNFPPHAEPANPRVD